VKTDEIPKLIEHLEPKLAMPDPELIRGEAGRRRTVRHRLMAVAGTLVLVAGIAALGSLIGDDETQTETVAGDSATRPFIQDAIAQADDPFTSAPTSGARLPADDFDARESLDDRSFFVRSMQNAPIDLPPNVGHLGFSGGRNKMSFTTGCEGASYEIEWMSSGFVVERENPDPFISANVRCLDIAKLSPFSEGDVVEARTGDVPFSFDLTVVGASTWTTSIFSVERLNSTSNGEVASIPFTVLAEDLAEGEPYSVAVIDNLGAVVVAAPAVDFDTHVVFVFDLAESSSPECQVRPMSDLVFDWRSGRLYPLVLLEGQESVKDLVRCLADAGQHRIVVSVERSVLPDSAFTLWINSGNPPVCCTDRPLSIEAGQLSVR